MNFLALMGMNLEDPAIGRSSNDHAFQLRFRMFNLSEGGGEFGGSQVHIFLANFLETLQSLLCPVEGAAGPFERQTALIESVVGDDLVFAKLFVTLQVVAGCRILGF